MKSCPICGKDVPQGFVTCGQPNCQEEFTKRLSEIVSLFEEKLGINYNLKKSLHSKTKRV